MNIVLFWIQWSGKWTQALKLQEVLSSEIFESGSQIRLFSQEDSPLAREVFQRINAGNLVPIKVIEFLLERFLQQHKNISFIFDGIPRNLEQKKIFDEMVPHKIIFSLDLSPEEVIQRIQGRRVCSLTGKPFGSDFLGDTNPENGAPLIARVDDTLPILEKRIATFLAESSPVLQAYKDEGVSIFHIDASLPIDEVHRNIMAVLHQC